MLLVVACFPLFHWPLLLGLAAELLAPHDKQVSRFLTGELEDVIQKMRIGRGLCLEFPVLVGYREERGLNMIWYPA